MRGFLVGVALGLAVGYAVGVRPPSPVVVTDSYNVRMVDLPVTGFQDKNTTNRRQRFVCKETP